jgi:hypothetical protein
MHGWLQISKSGFRFIDVDIASVISIAKKSGFVGAVSVATGFVGEFTSMPMCSFIAETAMAMQFAEPLRRRC